LKIASFSFFDTLLILVEVTISDESQKKLQDIVRGALPEGQRDHCTAVRNLLCQSFGADPTVKNEFESRTIRKEKQADFLELRNMDGILQQPCYS